MAILGTLIKKGIKLRENFHQAYSSPFDLQKNELRSLLFAARNTRFGTFYGFDQILSHFRKGHTDFFREFTSTVPLHDYVKINKEWWHLTRKGIKHVTWPGRTKYFALSSGTSDAASKQIPVTRDMTKAIQRTSIRQILSLSKYDLPPEFFEGGIMMIGGSTHLSKKGSFFEGDLSGIQAARLPFWFQHFYKPGKQIARGRDWEKKLDDITRNARKWDISIIVGVPAWIQLLLKKIIDHYQLNNIHELWHNLMVYVHGGVSFDPYRKGFEQLLGRPIWYIETYLASEGFIAYQDTPKSKTMKLVLDNGIFFEFIPFDDDHFLPTGEVRPEAATIMIDQVAEGVEYAVVLSTCAGAWR
ncbi:MAG: GH3 auxin-responsive promoter family protein, partial [Bacteroidota bacterium]